MQREVYLLSFLPCSAISTRLHLSSLHRSNAFSEVYIQMPCVRTVVKNMGAGVGGGAYT